MEGDGPDAETEKKLADNKLQYIEGSELERAWRASRRERMKVQEQKIWDEFIKEQDIIDSVYQDDPYQFKEVLPEDYVKEIIEKEPEPEPEPQISKSEKKLSFEEDKNVVIILKDNAESEHESEVDDEVVQIAEDVESIKAGQSSEDFLSGEEIEFESHSEYGSETELNKIAESNKLTKLAETAKKAEASKLVDHIIKPVEKNKKDEFIEDKNALVEKEELTHSPSTARLLDDQFNENEKNDVDLRSLHNNIYCVKLIDLRERINFELECIIVTLNQKFLPTTLDSQDLMKLKRRSMEFNLRFNRIHLYNIHRQLYDLKRHNKSLPFAKHTHFQSQMGRIVSVHQRMLQATQMLHKSIDQTWLMAEEGECVRSLSTLFQSITDECRNIPCPAENNLKEILEDKISETSVALLEALSGFVGKVRNVLSKVCVIGGESKTHTARTDMSVDSFTSRKQGNHISEARLSMYGLDTQRHNTKNKFNNKNKSNSSSSVVDRLYTNPLAAKKEAIEISKQQTKKRNIIRRPLMRDPQLGQKQRRPKELEVHTMVESVDYAKNDECQQTTDECQQQWTQVNAQSSLSQRSKESTPRCPKREPSSPPPPSLLRESERGTSATAQHNHNEQNDDKTPEKNEVEVSRILKNICAENRLRPEETTAKNAQLFSVNSSSARTTNTPHLLRILEESIQKKSPRDVFKQKKREKEDKLHLTFNVTEKAYNNQLNYRTKFVQHMLTSPLYANSAVGKPWEVIGKAADQIIDRLVMRCVKDIGINEMVKNLYEFETH